MKPTTPLVEVLNLRVTRWLATAILGALGGLVFLLHGAGPMETPHPMRADPPQVVQAWTMDPTLVLGSAIFGTLPPPVPNQRRAPCDPDLEEEIDGACWIPIAVKRCPEDKAFSHNGKCYGRALRAARVPSAGDPRTATVADP